MKILHRFWIFSPEFKSNIDKFLDCYTYIFIWRCLVWYNTDIFHNYVLIEVAIWQYYHILKCWLHVYTCESMWIIESWVFFPHQSYTPHSDIVIVFNKVCGCNIHITFECDFLFYNLNIVYSCWLGIVIWLLSSGWCIVRVPSSSKFAESETRVWMNVQVW